VDPSAGQSPADTTCCVDAITAVGTNQSEPAKSAVDAASFPGLSDSYVLGGPGDESYTINVPQCVAASEVDDLRQTLDALKLRPRTRSRANEPLDPLSTDAARGTPVRIRRRPSEQMPTSTPASAPSKESGPPPLASETSRASCKAAKLIRQKAEAALGAGSGTVEVTAEDVAEVKDRPLPLRSISLQC
jgi:hypothetical protein